MKKFTLTLLLAAACAVFASAVDNKGLLFPDVEGEYVTLSTTTNGAQISNCVTIEKSPTLLLPNRHIINNWITKGTKIQGIYEKLLGKFTISAGQKLYESEDSTATPGITEGGLDINSLTKIAKLYQLTDSGTISKEPIVFDVTGQNELTLVSGKSLIVALNLSELLEALLGEGFTYNGMDLGFLLKMLGADTSESLELYHLEGCEIMKPNGTITSQLVNADFTAADPSSSLYNTVVNIDGNKGVVCGVDGMACIPFTINGKKVTFAKQEVPIDPDITNVLSLFLGNMTTRTASMTAATGQENNAWELVDGDVEGIIDYEAGTITMNPWCFTTAQASLWGGSDVAILNNERKASAVITFPKTDNPNPGVEGDVNNDGAVDILDANIVINIILGADTNENYDGRADLNGDGIVDIFDENIVINKILGV